MTKTLTRSGLYELVWATPRSSLAKDLGVSDVAIGKACVQAFIPAPPPGFWARKAVGKTGRRPSLPIRLPGHSAEVAFGRDPLRRYQAMLDGEEPLVPPVFPESLDEQVAAATKIVGKVAACRDLSNPHKALKRVLDAEAKRRQKCIDRGWTWDKPYFDDVVHQRQLRVFNAIARAVTPVIKTQEVSVHDEFIRGVGTIRHLRMRVEFGGSGLELRFDQAERPTSRPRASAAKEPEVACLATGLVASQLGILEWKDLPENTLEAQLPTIVHDLLVRAETSMRHWAQDSHRRRVEYRAEVARKREAAERAREAERLEAIAAHREKVRQHIIEMGAQRRAAGDIRDMVSALSGHPDLHPKGDPQFDEWARLALSIANELDPMMRPLTQVISDGD